MQLDDDSPMPSGKYAGQKMFLIPAWYLIWYGENVPANYENQNIHDYINENMDVLLKELNNK